MSLATLTLALMMRVLSASGETLPWIDSTAVTAEAIADGCTAHPLPKTTPEQCAALLAEWGFHESRWNVEAEHDHGTGYGLFGTHASTLNRTVPYDARGQVDAALDLFATSWRICGKHPFAERAAWYASGGAGCEKDRGLAISRSRMSAAAKLLREARP